MASDLSNDMLTIRDSPRLISTVSASPQFAPDIKRADESPAFSVTVQPEQRRQSQRQLMDMATNSVADYISPMYQRASEKNGGFVVIDRKFGDLPLLWGKDKRPVFVYEIVELIEETLDFAELHAKLPTLSSTQLSAAVGFLRSLAQFNRKGLDIDALQDEAIEADPAFQEAVKQAVQDEETARVLAPL